MNKLSRAICFATELFDGKIRKGENKPAIFHSLEAAAITQTVCDDEDVVCAAILHDTIEDTNIKFEDIRKRFGDRVADLVASETEEKDRQKDAAETWFLRKKATLAKLEQNTDIGVFAVWLGDKLSNMRAFSRMQDSIGKEMWNKFNQKDPEAHCLYYKEIAEKLKVFEDSAAYAEFTALIKKVFGR